VRSPLLSRQTLRTTRRRGAPHCHGNHRLPLPPPLCPELLSVPQPLLLPAPPLLQATALAPHALPWSAVWTSCSFTPPLSTDSRRSIAQRQHDPAHPPPHPPALQLLASQRCSRERRGVLKLRSHSALLSFFPQSEGRSRGRGGRGYKRKFWSPVAAARTPLLLRSRGAMAGLKRDHSPSVTEAAYTAGVSMAMRK
jgi:hypothetical protein